MADYLNIIIGGLGVTVAILAILNAWLLFAVTSWRSSINELRRQDGELRKEIGAINLLVAGQYVTNDRFERGMEKQAEAFKDMLATQTGILVGAIDRLDKKLDGKADK